MDVSDSTVTCMVSPSLLNLTTNHWRWFSCRFSMQHHRSCSACYCGCRIMMWPSSISQGKCFSLLMGSHDCPGPSAEIKLNVAINLIQFSQEHVQELWDKTVRNPILAPLRDIIISGWPDAFKQVTKPLPYWSYRDELSIEDGIILILGSEQVLIPAAMQNYILDALHTGLQWWINLKGALTFLCFFFF